MSNMSDMSNGQTPPTPDEHTQPARTPNEGYDYRRLNYAMPPFAPSETDTLLGPWFYEGGEEVVRRRAYEYQAMTGRLLPPGMGKTTTPPGGVPIVPRGRAGHASRANRPMRLAPPVEQLPAMGQPAPASRPLLPPDPLAQYEDGLVHHTLAAKRESDAATTGLSLVREARRLFSGHYTLDQAQTQRAVSLIVERLRALASQGGIHTDTQATIAGAALAIAHVAEGWREDDTRPLPSLDPSSAPQPQE